MLSPAIKPRNYRGLFLLVALAFGGVLQADAQCTQAEAPIALFEAQTLAADEIPTVNAANHVGLGLVEEAFSDIRQHKYNAWTLLLPFLGGKTMPIELESFLPFSDAFMIGRSQAGGKFAEEVYRPKLLSYRVVSPGIKGTIVVMEDFVMGTIQYRGRQYDLSAIRNGADGKHVLFLLADAADPMEFECGVDEYGPRRDVMPMGMQPPPSTSNQLTDCVEVAIDIDFHTYGTFGNDCYPAVEWALAILAGVNTIYTESVDALINVQASYIHVWETTDPYDGITNDANSMLDTFRLEWQNNSNLAGIQRDLVHLLTRRENTGTGGIAYLDVVCFPAYAAGFSSYLQAGNTYDLNNYAWNLNVVGHELGHNFGSNHTHWCGWSNGPIDNCYDVEGSCTNNPQAQVGTMMSYCHAVAGGSVNLEFHPTVVAEAFVPTITSDGSCFTTCVEMTTSCQYFGCTDSAACNYDPNAVEDDGSCAYEIDGCGVCGGDDSTCSGCTDSAACNYDPDATIEDGGCFYPRRQHVRLRIHCGFHGQPCRRRDSRTNPRSVGLRHRSRCHPRLHRHARGQFLGQRDDGRPDSARWHVPSVRRVQPDAGVSQCRVVASRLEHERCGHLHRDGRFRRTHLGRGRMDHHHLEFLGLFRRRIIRHRHHVHWPLRGPSRHAGLHGFDGVQLQPGCHRGRRVV